jgi:hypothetical protein
VYRNTVGANSVLELGVLPDNTGSIPADQMAVLQAFGDYVRECHSAHAAVAATSGTAASITVTLPTTTVINRVILQEDLSAGQLVLAFTVSALPPGGYAPKPVVVASGTAIGHKRILYFDSGPLPAVSVTVTATALYPGFTAANFANVAVYAPCAGDTPAAATAGAAPAGAVAEAAYQPCHMPYTPFTKAVESPCFLVAAKLSGGVTVRVYDAAHDNGATLVSANVSAAEQPWSNGLEVAANYMFDYFTGQGNAAGANLTAYLTAPLMFRPARGKTPESAPWFAEMVLAPSAWGPSSQPPRAANGFVVLQQPWAPLQVAVLHRTFKGPPGEAQFLECDAALRAVVSAPGSGYAVDEGSAHTPTFAFYFPRDDMPPIPSGPFDIECWVAVVAA